MADHYYLSMASGSVITYTNWNEMMGHIYMSSTGFWGISSEVVPLKNWRTQSGAKYSKAYESGQKAMYSISHADDISSWDATRWTNSGLLWNGSNWVAWKSGGTGTGYWSLDGSDIYYSDGEVVVGHQNFDVGAYRFQVSGDSYFSGAVTFIGEISGISAPTYNSGAANKKYVDDNIASYELHVYQPEDSNIPKDGSNRIFFSGQNTVYVYSGTNQPNTIIISGTDVGVATLAGDLVGNLSGSSYTYGLKDMDFLSSQAISGGIIKGKIISGSDGGGIYAHFISANASNLAGTGVWDSDGDNIYYGDGEVRVGHSQFDMGDYKFQVSGDSYFSGSVTFIGEISGISQPTYNSGVANKRYVDLNAGGFDMYTYPQNVLVPRDGSNRLWFSGQNTTYIYSAQGQPNTIIISSSTGSGETPSTWSWNIPTATSGLSVSNIGKVSGNLALYIDDYIASTNVQSKFLHSGVILNAISTQTISGGTIRFATLKGVSKDATAANIEELVDGSETTLHSHAGGSAGGYPSGQDGAIQYASGGAKHGGQHQLVWDRLVNKLIVSGTIKSTDSISSQAGLYAHFVSANNSNLAGIVTKADFKASTGTWTFVSSNTLWAGTGYISAQTGIYASFISANSTNLPGTGYWTKTGDDIYYDDGKVLIGYSGFDLGNYNFQVSGDSYFSGSVTFIGEISGLADPTYASGVSNKHYVDTISSNLDSKIDALGAFDAINYITSSNAISRFIESGTTLNALSSNRLWVGNEYISAQTGLFAHFISANNSNLTTSVNSIEDLGDVDVMTPTDNQVLTWDAGTSKWSSQTPGVGQWTAANNGIYYSDEVYIGHSEFDVGDYKFQVSGDTYLSGNVQFIGEISGVSDPTYNSGAANKHYVDTISGGLSTRIDALGGFDPENYITSSNAIERFADSSQYSSDKSNFQSAYDWVNSSSQRYEELLASGTKYTTAYDERGSQIAGNNLTWNGSQLDATGGGSGFTPNVQPDGEDISADGGNKIYFSGQGCVSIISGQNTVIISGMTSEINFMRPLLYISGTTLTGAFTYNSLTSLTGWHDPRFIADGITFVDGEFITIGEELAGKKLMITAAIGGDSNNRCEVGLYLIKNDTETIRYIHNYVARDADQNLGGVTLPMVMVSGDTDDTFSFAYYIDPDGTYTVDSQQFYISVIGEKSIGDIAALKGNDGAKGDAGSPGDIVWLGTWAAGEYNLHDTVYYSGSSYTANTTTSEHPPHADWDVVASGGVDGEKGAPGPPGSGVDQLPFIHLGKTDSQNCGGSNGDKTNITWQTTISNQYSDYYFNFDGDDHRIFFRSGGRYSINSTVGCTNTGSNRITLMLQYIQSSSTDSTTITRGRSRNYSRGTGYADLSPRIQTENDFASGECIVIQTEIDDTDQSNAVNTNVAECEVILRRLANVTP